MFPWYKYLSVIYYHIDYWLVFTSKDSYKHCFIFFYKEYSGFRQAIEKLMTLNPLADHIDLRDHYLAFIDLDKFGIEKDVPDER